MSIYDQIDTNQVSGLYDKINTKQTKAQILHDRAATNKRSLKSLRFPSDIDTDGTGNVIRFNINLPEGSKYLGNGQYQAAVDPKTGQPKTSTYRQQDSNSLARRFSSNYVRTTTVIDLYMPDQIQTNYASDWNVEEIGVLGAALDAGFGVSDINSWSDAEDAWKVIKNTVPASLANAFAGTLQALTPFNFQSAKKVATSTAVNPYIEVVFNGVQNRSFSFTFKMVPRNVREQITVRNIVQEFRFHRAPEVKYQGQSNYWLFPSEFDIKFLHRGSENPWLFKISTCALTNVSINHAPEGNYASHADGSPFSTEMTLEFTEMEYLTKKRHMEGY